MKKQIAFAVLVLLSFNLHAQPWVEMVTDICPGACYSTPSQMTYSNGKIYFTADDGTHHEEPWVTDGTVAGTYMLKDIRTNFPTGSNARYFTSCNGKTFFIAVDSSQALWVTDGTQSGTSRLCRYPPFGHTFLIEYNNLLYFRSSDAATGEELWVSDGTVAGTHMLTDIYPGGDASPSFPAVMNGKLYFSARDAANGHELWETDGTVTGTKMVADVYPGPNSSAISWLTTLNNKLYFSCVTAAGNELWVSDGTGAGTQPVKTIDTSGMPTKIQNMMTDGNKLYFSAKTSDNTSPELFVSDGTAAGTFMLKDINPLASNTYMPKPVVCNGKVFFVQADTIGQREKLWMTDGTATGTVKITDTLFDVESLICFNNKLHYKATATGAIGPLTQVQVWTTDGTIGHVTMVKPGFEPIPHSVTSTDFAQLGNSLYYRATYDNNNGNELWRLTDFPASVTTTKKNDFTFYPNPAVNTVTVNLTDAKNATIRICSVMGQVVLTQKITTPHTVLDIQALPDGIYALYVQHDSNISVQKFIKNSSN